MSESKTQHTILFVDDDPRITGSLKALFRRKYKVFVANSGDEALSILEQQQIDVLVSDQRMPEMLGSELLATVSRTYPQTMRILLTGFMDRQAIVDSINDGEVYRFINKPWENDEIDDVIAQAALASKLPVDTMFDSDGSSGSEIDDLYVATKDKAILILEQNQNVRNQIRKLCSQQEIMIYSVQNVEQVINTATSRGNIGVVMIELSGQVAKQAIQTINLLKQVRPELVTIALTEDYDAHMAVELINQGQVFRYLGKPIDVDDLHATIKSGFRRYLYLKGDSTLQQRYKVDKPKDVIVSSLKGLFGKLLSADLR
jgi:DNA-binding NtrC family response regulator